MIQEILPHVYKNEYYPYKPEDDSVVLIYQKREIFLKKGEGMITYPCYKEVKGVAVTYLFEIDGRKYFLADAAISKQLAGYTWENLSLLRQAKPQHLAFAGITGAQLSCWYEMHRFCGGCKTPMQHDKKERMLYCENCHSMEYPKICPAVIVAVIDRSGREDKILVSKYANREYQRYALIAGFAEIGESIEDTVRREVMEEVGLRIKNIKYYKSQPWSFTDSLLFGFVVELDGDNTITLEEEELSVAEWKTREELHMDGPEISLTREMMWQFKVGNI